MTLVVTTRAAERDLSAIADHVGGHDIAAAGRLIADLRAAVSSLGNLPARQRVRAEYGDGRRRLNCREYAIVYVYDEVRGVVEVERILHSRRNIASLLHP